MLPNMLFINIGWMEKYQGPEKEGTIGGHAYLQEHDSGFECYNFLPIEEKCYGYVPGKERFPNIKKLGAARSATSIGDILVVWMAKNPSTHKTCIVGWYSNAVVHNSGTDFPEFSKRNDEKVWNYCVEADSKGCVLLPLAERTYEIPNCRVEKGGFGQSPMWYAVDRPDIRKKVFDYIQKMQSGYPITSHSWILLSDSVAEKKLDISSFDHRGSGIPKDILPFFDYVAGSSRKDLTFIYDDVIYSAHLASDPKQRVKVMWGTAFKSRLTSFFPKKQRAQG
ncbi:MAG: hypothetical protein MI749_22585, partial [Desulfovibrionales bacterium]|nr:hypothetical protein [Desulfovibrionales bacterium]